MSDAISSINTTSSVSSYTEKKLPVSNKIEIKDNKDIIFKSDNLDIKSKKTNNPFEAKPVNNPTNKPSESNEFKMIFFSDAHSRFELTDKFINIANEKNPDLIIDGGDIVHDTTEPELDKAWADRNKIKSPVYVVNGNHDVEIRGPITHPVKEIPDFQTLDHKGVHIIMLDNENQLMPEELFKKLEDNLEENKGKPIIVAMHVPPVLSKEPLTVKLGKKLPMNFASPVMTDEKQVKRFTDLMSKYQVSAVLTGHTHKADYMEKDGVKYINAGASGGLTPTLGVDNEFLELVVNGKDVKFEKVVLKEGSNDPVKFAHDMFGFYSDLNSFNHDKLGWNYIPSASVQYQLGTRFTETKETSSTSATMTASMERNLNAKGSFFGAGTLGVGARDLNLQIEGGYKHRIIGDYNKNVFLSGAVGANGGVIAGKTSAGVGATLGAGVEYKNFTLSVGQEFNTNYKATKLAIGFRF